MQAPPRLRARVPPGPISEPQKVYRRLLYVHSMPRAGTGSCAGITPRLASAAIHKVRAHDAGVAREGDLGGRLVDEVQRKRQNAGGAKKQLDPLPRVAVMTVEDAGVANVDSLATANGPWLLIMAVVGTVAVYARQRRMARRSAATKQFG